MTGWPKTYMLASVVKVCPISKAEYLRLHKWARANVRKQNECPSCKLDRKLEITNISNTYRKEKSDWKWMCRGCHRYSHGFKHSKETKLKISKKVSGVNNGFYGKNWNDYGGHPKGMKGKKHSEKTKKNIGKSLRIKRYANSN